MKQEADANAVEFDREQVEKALPKNHPFKDKIVDSTLKKITMDKEMKEFKKGQDYWFKAEKDSKDEYNKWWDSNEKEKKEKAKTDEDEKAVYRKE